MSFYFIGFELVAIDYDCAFCAHMFALNLDGSILNLSSFEIYLLALFSEHELHLGKRLTLLISWWILLLKCIKNFNDFHQKWSLFSFVLLKMNNNESFYFYDIYRHNDCASRPSDDQFKNDNVNFLTFLCLHMISNFVVFVDVIVIGNIFHVVIK